MIILRSKAFSSLLRFRISGRAANGDLGGATAKSVFNPYDLVFFKFVIKSKFDKKTAMRFLIAVFDLVAFDMCTLHIDFETFAVFASEEGIGQFITDDLSLLRVPFEWTV